MSPPWPEAAGLAAQLAAAAVDLLFPPSCGACSAPLPALRLLCEACADEATALAAPGCERCGLPAVATEACPDCRPAVEDGAGSGGFDVARALYAYGGPIEAALVRAKFGDAPHVAQAAGQELGRALARGALAPLGAQVDAVVPIPVGSGRLRTRGYDQALLMARSVARALGKPLRPHLLVRRRETSPQASLGRAARYRNVADAFAVRGEAPRGCSVLLVDDVLTTGATAHAAAAALRTGGAARVEVATCARALLDGGVR